MHETRALQALSWLGGAYSNSYAALDVEPSNTRTSEYLIVLDTQTGSDYHTYIDTHPDIEFLSESVYPNTIRVALTVPVGDTIKQLEARPFVRFVIRNLPIFFCH